MAALGAALRWTLLIPVITGSIYGLLCVLAMTRLRAARPRPRPTSWPPVTVLKPVCGLEKDLLENLRSACRQDYPDYQVILSAQSRDDPAFPLLHEIQAEFGPERVEVVVDSSQTATCRATATRRSSRPSSAGR